MNEDGWRRLWWVWSWQGGGVLLLLFSTRGTASPLSLGEEHKVNRKKEWSVCGYNVRWSPIPSTLLLLKSIVLSEWQFIAGLIFFSQSTYLIFHAVATDNARWDQKRIDCFPICCFTSQVSRYQTMHTQFTIINAADLSLKALLKFKNSGSLISDGVRVHASFYFCPWQISSAVPTS